MQKPEWRYIENFVDPDLFQQAFDWVEANGNTLSLHFAEAGSLILKSSLIHEDELYTEIGFGRKYLRHAYCRCGKAGKKLCIHLIAAIILHRRNNEELDKPIKPLATKDIGLPNRISIPVILSQIPKLDLDRFLQRYARTNKQFGQALKLHFASKVQVSSPEQKYHDLIKSMTRLIPNALGKIAKGSMQSLFWISEELLLQADDLIALENPIESFAICHELLQKYHSIYRKLDMYFGEYEKFWILIHQRLRSILDLTLAPDYRIELEGKLMILFTDPGYPMIHSPHNLYEVLFFNADPDSRKNLNAVLLKKIGRRESNPLPLVTLAKTAMRIQDESLLKEAFEGNNDLSKWLSTLEIIVSSHKEYARQLGQWLMAQTKDEFWKFKFMDRLWSFFPEDPASKKYALALLQYQPDEKYLKYSIDYHINADLVIKSLQNSLQFKSKNLLIDFYISHHMMSEAKALLESPLSLEQLKAYTQRLWPKEAAWLEQSYKSILTTFLENHLGPPSVSKVQNILAFLHMIKAHALADDLQKWIKKTFQDHTSLSEKLY